MCTGYVVVAVGYDQPGHASCGHMETIAHGNYHDAGHNQYGRAPDTDCASEVDTEGHLLGESIRLFPRLQATVQH